MTRETAFVRAISSAGITHSLTVNCSSGRTSKCGCGPSNSKRQGRLVVANKKENAAIFSNSPCLIKPS